MIKKIFLCAVLFFALSAHAMENGELTSREEKNDAPVEGDLFIIPRDIHPAEFYDTGPFIKWLEEFLEKQIDPTEQLVCVWASDEISENWTDHGHPRLKNRFPRFLPLTLLANQQEEGLLELNTQGQPVLLHCRQRPYRYAHGLDFPEMLTWLLLGRPVNQKTYKIEPALMRQKTIERLAKLAEFQQSKEESISNRESEQQSKESVWEPSIQSGKRWRRRLKRQSEQES